MIRLRASAGSGQDWLPISMALLAPLMLASALMGRQSSSAPLAYDGMCDASAAILAGGRVLVLNDEDQQQTLLRLFSIRKGGLPQKTFRLDTSSLALDQDEPDIDLEAAAVLGQKLLLIGSHSRSRKAKPRVSRQRLFAVRWPFRPQGDLVSVEGKVYKSLLTDLEGTWRTNHEPGLATLNLDRELPPEEGGVSIEGMASTLQAGLLIGFRSPVVSGKALVAHLQNPEDMLKGRAAHFASTTMLDLDGDGVRDIIRDGSGYLILSGAVGSGKTFGLYRWPGPGKEARLLQRKPVSQLGVGKEGFPEALVRDPKSGDVLLFLDEGDACKEGNDKGFDSVRLRIPSPSE
jgi:Protein of unknown function (DUF3616)